MTRPCDGTQAPATASRRTSGADDKCTPLVRLALIPGESKAHPLRIRSFSHRSSCPQTIDCRRPQGAQKTNHPSGVGVGVGALSVLCFDFSILHVTQVV